MPDDPATSIAVDKEPAQRIARVSVVKMPPVAPRHLKDVSAGTNGVAESDVPRMIGRRAVGFDVYVSLLRSWGGVLVAQAPDGALISAIDSGRCTKLPSLTGYSPRARAITDDVPPDVYERIARCLPPYAITQPRILVLLPGDVDQRFEQLAIDAARTAGVDDPDEIHYAYVNGSPVRIIVEKVVRDQLTISTNVELRM